MFQPTQVRPLMSSVADVRIFRRLLPHHHLKRRTCQYFLSTPSSTPRTSQTPLSTKPLAYPTNDDDENDGAAGRSLVASCYIAKGAEIYREIVADPKHILKLPTRYTIRKEDGLHLDVQSMIRYTNHMCVFRFEEIFLPELGF